jgi:hypothetical protein
MLRSQSRNLLGILSMNGSTAGAGRKPRNAPTQLKMSARAQLRSLRRLTVLREGEKEVGAGAARHFKESLHRLLFS